MGAVGERRRRGKESAVSTMGKGPLMIFAHGPPSFKLRHCTLSLRNKSQAKIII